MLREVQREGEANVILIPANGPKKYWHSDEPLELEITYQLGGIDRGYIQVVPVGLAANDNDRDQMMVHEEGKLRNLPLNEAATEIYEETYGPFDIIVGPALILKGKARWT